LELEGKESTAGIQKKTVRSKKVGVIITEEDEEKLL